MAKNTCQRPTGDILGDMKQGSSHMSEQGMETGGASAGDLNKGYTSGGSARDSEKNPNIPGVSRG